MTQYVNRSTGQRVLYKTDGTAVFMRRGQTHTCDSDTVDKFDVGIVATKVAE